MLNSLIEALTETPVEYAASTTAEFKLIPLQNTAINRDGTEELVVRQNSFLHVTTVTSVVNAGNGDELFTSKTGDEDRYNESIREWGMKAKTADDTYLFHLVEEDRRGQCCFLHEEIWLDECFNGILQKYGADECKRILGGESHVRRKNQIQDSPKIAACLQGLSLTTTLPLRRRDNHLQAPPR